jgi:non-heme chloroperoxidase
MRMRLTVTITERGGREPEPGEAAQVDTKNPDRGPLLIFTGEVDHAVPPAMSRAAYKKQRRNPGLTEHIEMPGRDHALVIDERWYEVCDASLEFLARATGRPVEMASPLGPEARPGEELPALPPARPRPPPTHMVKKRGFRRLSSNF